MQFGYLQVRTVEEAIDLLRKYDGSAKVIAGGTDLILQARSKQINPSYVVDIRRISDGYRRCFV